MTIIAIANKKQFDKIIQHLLDKHRDEIIRNDNALRTKVKKQASNKYNGVF